ncbi:RNA polymerase sporulation sigma factor SigH [Blautia sp.]|uniref:RNA polymerase sigma factor SigS n=1 Tax=Blautia glucerasea TaxID=536633 RepID=A0A6N2TYC5_9FIRM
MDCYGQFSDEQLIERLRGGETEISDYLMDKYKGLVRKKARAMYLIGGDTDDLIQEGMIGLFKAVQDYRPDREASFQTFASLCIERQLYSAVKNSTRQKHIPLNSYVSLSEEAETGSLEGLWSENPEALIIDRENTGSLEKQISQTLSPMENKVLDYYLKGYSYVQIAELMNKQSKSIDNALQRIRGKIRDYIKKSKNEIPLSFF